MCWSIVILLCYQYDSHCAILVTMGAVAQPWCPCLGVQIDYFFNSTEQFLLNA